MKQTYWNNTGRYQAAADLLAIRIPDSGPCEDAKGRNKALDRYRRVSNCYYDLFNNGLCNRAAEFRALFGFGVGGYRNEKGRLDYDAIERHGKVEAKMDEFILNAAREQGIPILPTETLAIIPAPLVTDLIVLARTVATLNPYSPNATAVLAAQEQAKLLLERVENKA